MTEQTRQALTRIIERSLTALPDSLEQRKQVLRDLLTITPNQFPHRQKISGLLFDLQTHERNQCEFLSLLQKP